MHNDTAYNNTHPANQGEANASSTQLAKKVGIGAAKPTSKSFPLWPPVRTMFCVPGIIIGDGSALSTDRGDLPAEAPRDTSGPTAQGRRHKPARQAKKHNQATIYPSIHHSFIDIGGGNQSSTQYDINESMNQLLLQYRTTFHRRQTGREGEIDVALNSSICLHT